MGDLPRRLAVARGDEPADLVVRGGRVLSVFTREWLEVDVAVCDGVIAGLGEYEGAETLDAAGAYRRPRLHRCAHAPREREVAPGRVRTPRPAARNDGDRGRPARDRERARHRRHPLAASTLERPPARGLLHGVLVRAGVAVRVAAPAVQPGRPREPAAAAARDRPRRDDELPRRRSPAIPRSSRSSRSPGRTTSTAMRPACSAATCRRMPPPGSTPTTRR